MPRQRKPIGEGLTVKKATTLRAIDPNDPNIPLTPYEQRFVAAYVRVGSAPDAVRQIEPEISQKSALSRASTLLKRANIQEAIKRMNKEIEKEGIANGAEVMGYFTAVMRGEIKDQFGLDAPLTERTRAAQELAKRTVDIELKANEKNNPAITVKLVRD